MTKRRDILLSGLALMGSPTGVIAADAPMRAAADEFRADKNGVRLWVYRKRAATAQPSARPFCVHGSSYSARVDLEGAKGSGKGHA